MGATVRVIPRLDIKGPNLIKGIQFDGHRVLGTAEQFADYYYRAGADELIYQDSVASLYRRNSLLDIVRKTASKVFIPLTVAGGIRSVDDIRKMLRAGADKVAINTAAVERPELLKEASKAFGRQCVVASIEAFRRKDGRQEVWVDYGREPTGLDVHEWAKRVVDLGAGEILLTSINHDGMGKGYDLELIEEVSKASSVPIIACGGAGKGDDFVRAVCDGHADAVAAASVFHYRYAVPTDKPFMSYHEAQLRMGKHIDSGNVDFLNHGYGGQRSIPVTPTSIEEAKQALADAGIEIRPLPHASEEAA
ncbi:MAG: imidazole glycerol phosphate synthase cyclase subunit [Deltaproteobacteria bacterium]|nr:imidazole glycerol phosphate synthase cyclase subunit [Deltaproteobacteria bacterium]